MNTTNKLQSNQPNGAIGSLRAAGVLAILTPLLIIGGAVLGFWVKNSTDSLLAMAAVVIPVFGFTYWLGTHSRIAKAATPDDDQSFSSSHR